jgi:hypothetical protein
LCNIEWHYKYLYLQDKVEPFRDKAGAIASSSLNDRDSKLFAIVVYHESRRGVHSSQIIFVPIKLTFLTNHNFDGRHRDSPPV